MSKNMNLNSIPKLGVTTKAETKSLSSQSSSSCLMRQSPSIILGLLSSLVNRGLQIWPCAENLHNPPISKAHVLCHFLAELVQAKPDTGNTTINEANLTIGEWPIPLVNL